jgi:hypothetical protein
MSYLYIISARGFLLDDPVWKHTPVSSILNGEMAPSLAALLGWFKAVFALHAAHFIVWNVLYDRHTACPEHLC